MLHHALAQVIAGNSLTEAEAESAMTAMITGKLPPAQVAALLAILHAKGETIDEIVGMARGMRAESLKVPIPADIVAMDTCGTGGDGAGTFNISTAAAFVIAACGQPVAKHGNRAATSACGSADVLEALGVQVNLPPEAVARCISETNIGFMFAPTYHPAMKYVVPVRRELGFRTIFNILGPITNPAGVSTQLVGVPTADLVQPMATALARLGGQRALVVHGEDGLDEFSLSGATRVAEVDGASGTIREYMVMPQDVGLTPAPRETLKGGDAKMNATLLRGILAGEISGPPADSVALNAGAALYIAGRVATIREGVALAQNQLRPDGALRTLGAFVALTQDLAVQTERELVRSIQGK